MQKYKGGLNSGKTPSQQSIPKQKLLENLQLLHYDTARDEAAALELNKLSVLQSAISKQWNDEWNVSIYYIREAYQHRRGDFFSIYYEGKLIAMGGLQMIDAEKSIIKKVRVHPDFRGFGLAKILVDKCESVARELGYKIVRGDTNAENKPIQALLEGKGYVFTHEVYEYGQQMRVYEKSL
jgi:GNAT superfamily N-acetyltransferase